MCIYVCMYLCVHALGKYYFQIDLNLAIPFAILKATDDRRADLSEAFYIGQSVRSNILDVGASS